MSECDDLDELIAAVEAEFAVVHGPERVPFSIGDLENNEHACWPRIEWSEPDGTIGQQRLNGYTPDRAESDEDPDDEVKPTHGSIATMSANIEVECWGETRAKARELAKHLILAASRVNRFGVTFERYEHVVERHQHGGVKFKLIGSFELPVPNETEHTVGYVTLRRHEWTVTGQGESVHGENEVPDP